ncbi:MAG: hypothetical protein RLZZ543_998, partial [Bacteroidota bacterium]
MSDSLLEYNLPLSVLMSAVEHAPALVLISSTSTDGVDQQVRIEYVNQVFVRSIGFSRKEIKGEDLLKYLSFSDPAGQPRSLLAMLLFGSTFRDDVILQCADGIRREVYFSVTAFEENNRLYHVWTQQQQSIEDSPSIGASKDASFLH